jgi:hypothetical protein
MDSFDSFESVLFMDPESIASLFETANSTWSNPSDSIPTDMERTTGYTTQGFCVIA